MQDVLSTKEYITRLSSWRSYTGVG